MKANKTHIQRLVATAILAAIVVVLQTFVVIPLGPFTVTLTLVPIMIGAILLGPACGAFLGGVFGVTVAIQVVTGAAGPFSFMMFEQLPIITIVICLVKGIVAGLVTGLIHKLLSQKGRNKLGVILSAISCPICNTGIFVVGLLVFYQELVTKTAAEGGFATVVAFVLISMIGLNFLVEFALNVLLIPVVLRVISAIRSKF